MSNRNLKPIDQLHPSAKRSVKQLLSTARRWHKGEYANDDNTACCLAGALEVVYGDGPEFMEAETKVLAAIRKFTKKGSKAPRIANFNDAPTRSFRDIQTVVRMAGV